MEIILGLDISTSCIGLTLASVDDDKRVVPLQITHFKLRTASKIKGIEALFLKTSYFEEVLENYRDISNYVGGNLKIDKVIIEEPLVSSNNSETVSTLLRFNGMISLSVYHILGVIPYFISSYDARKYSFPELMAIRKFNKKGNAYDLQKIRKALKKNELVLFGEYPWDCDKKLILWSKVNDMYSDIKWQYNNDGKLKKENFDASDSLICVLGYVNKICLNGYKTPKITGFNELEDENGVIIAYKTRFGNKEYDKIIEIRTK